MICFSHSFKSFDKNRKCPNCGLTEKDWASGIITLPPIERITERIKACRAELLALRRLHKLAKAELAAREAKERRDEPPNEPVYAWAR